MGRRSTIGTLKALLALAMLQSPMIPQANAKGGGSVCESKESCKRAAATAKTKAGGVATAASAATPGDSMNGGAGTLGGASTATAGLACDVVKACTDLKEKCKPAPGGCKKEDCDEIQTLIGQAQAECTQAGGAAAGAGQTQSATGGGGDMSQMMMPLMMAGMMAAMMMKKKKKEDEKPVQDPYAALQLNGQIDCSKFDAFEYQGCNAYMEKKCATQLDEASCTYFSNRYCNNGGVAGQAMAGQVQASMIAAPPVMDPTTGMAMSVPVMGAPGEGMGSGFCQNVMAYNFCKSAGRESCPSCLQLQKNSSPACALNPNLCMAQNSMGEIEKAKVSCPTDPAFSNPNFSNTTTQLAMGTNPGAPAVVLPQSIGANGSAGGARTVVSLNGASVSTGGSNAAINGGSGMGTNGQASREGQVRGNVASNASGGGGGGSASGGAGYVPASAGGREIAAAQGGGYNPASVGSLEVQPKFAPSLFNTSSQVYRNRCLAGRLNCP